MAAHYRIISQVPSTWVDAGGQPVRGYIVRFVTIPSGAYGRVQVDEAVYGAEAVDAAVTPLAAELERVAAL